MPRGVFTVGHSTHSPDELRSLLRAAGIRAVADVRAFPGSGRHPQYNAGALANWLPPVGIGYVGIPDLVVAGNRSTDR